MKREILFILYYFVVHFAIAKDDIPVVDNRLDKIEELDLPELLNVSLSSKLGHHQANILYKWKYGDKLVEISILPNDDELYTWNDTIHVSHDIAGNFLRGFGKSIGTLSLIGNHYHENVQKENEKLINLYCSETLVEFQRRFFREGAFDDMQKPFERVERVIFNGNWKKLKGNSLSPEKLFPKMRALDLTLWSDGIIFDYHYPHLDELKTYISPSDGFIKFIERNPQIKKLYLNAPSSVGLLKTVSDKLPELVVLEFRWPNDFASYPDLVIQLNYVKEVLIKDLHIQSGSIVFKKMEKLQLELNDASINFIAENKQLKSLTTGKFNDSTLLTLSSSLSNLVEANLGCDSSVTVESIVKFLESNPQMEELILNLAKSSITSYDFLSEKLKNKWNVAPVNGNFIKINLTKVHSNLEMPSVALKYDISVVNTELDKIEELDLLELLNISLSSTLGHRQTNILYKWKYGDKLVEISFLPNDGELFILNDTIHVSHGLAGNFLRAFGKSIGKLSLIYNHYYESVQKENEKLINLYCSETLVEFQGRYFKEGAFDDMQKPFNKVERVIFNGEWKELKGNSLSPDKLFPKVRAFDLICSDGVIFDYHYPHLEEVNIYVTPSSGFIKFIEKNPRIKKLYLQAETSVELLKTVNDKLIELNVLEFHWPNDSMTYPDLVIQFKYAKEVSIKDLRIRSGNVTFDQLEKLQLELDDAWIGFVGENKQLKSLTAGKFNDSTLLSIASSIDSLIEANLRCDSSVTVETIALFLENNPQMERMILNLVKSSITFFDSLSEKLKNKWNVAPINKSFNKLNLTKLEISSIDVKNDISLVDNRLDKIDELDLPDLINVSLSSDLGYRQANILYKWKYGDNPVEINCMNNGEIYIWNDTIYICYSIAEEYLKAFGKSIGSLSMISNCIHESKLKENGKLVNLYCSETLKEFEARFFKEGAFDDMQKPFENVERVIFNGEWKGLKENSLSPEKLFPKIRALDLTYTDGVIFDHHFPYLNELKTCITPSSEFIKFIERNPQIKRLYLQGPTSVELLKTVSDKLHELDVLEFRWPNDFISYPDHVINFHSVREASIIDYNNLRNRSGSITFEQLDWLQLISIGGLDDTWIDFITSNRELKTLIAGDFTNSTLLALSSNVNNLIEANFHCDCSVTVEIIVQFLENNSQIEKMTLNLAKGSITFFVSLSEKLKNKYNVVPVNRRFIELSLTKLEESSELDENTEHFTETVTQNATIAENSASNDISSIFLTATLAAFVVNVITFI